MLPAGTVADANNRRRAILILCATLLSTLLFVAKTSKYPHRNNDNDNYRFAVNRKHPVHPNHHPLVPGVLARKECAADYEACGAIPAPTASSRCCNPNFFCYRKPPYFSQCRPRVRVASTSSSYRKLKNNGNGRGYGHRNAKIEHGAIGIVVDVSTYGMGVKVGNYIRRIHEPLVVLDKFLRIRQLEDKFSCRGCDGEGRLLLYRKSGTSWTRHEVGEIVEWLVRDGVVLGMRLVYM